MDSLQYSRSLPELDHYDVIVCGGGPSGIPAALAARRAGRKTLLIEITGQLGGVGTSAGVSHLLASRTNDNQVCVAGIFKEITEELAARGGAVNPDTIKTPGKYNPHGWTGKVSNLTYGVPFAPILMTILLDEKMLEPGVDVLYFTNVVDVLPDPGGSERLGGIVVSNKSGAAGGLGRGLRRRHRGR